MYNGFNNSERNIIYYAISNVFSKYILKIESIFWSEPSLRNKTLDLIELIIISHLHSLTKQINESEFKGEEFINKEITKIKTQLELSSNNTEDRKQYFILYSLVILILDYANILDKEDNNDTNNNTNNSNKDNENNKDNNYKKESLKLLIYLIQNSLYKYLYESNNINYKNKLILIDTSKLKLLLSDNRARNYFMLLLSNLKLDYILDLIIHVNKNFINNYKELNTETNEIKNEINKTNEKTEKIKLLIKYIKQTINFIKNNLAPLLFLSDIIAIVVKAMLKQPITKTKEDSEPKTLIGKIKNKVSGIINKVFNRKTNNKRINENKINIKANKSELEYVEPDEHDIIFNNVFNKYTEKITFPEPQIGLTNKEFEDFDFVIRARTMASFKNTAIKQPIKPNNTNKTNINDSIYTNVHSRVSKCNIDMDNDDLNKLLNVEYNYTNKKERKSEIYNKVDEYQQEFDKNNQYVKKSSLDDEQIDIEDNKQNIIEPNNNLEKDNPINNNPENPHIEHEDDLFKDLLDNDLDKTSPNDDDPNKPRHKINKSGNDFGGRGI